jgi:NAD-dependent SIR2 family protein deacetylase
MNLEQVKAVVNEADTVYILAGAGLSAEIGIPVYWTGDHARYGETKSEEGYTALEHAHGPLWSYDPDSQVEYFKKLYASIKSISLDNSVYSKLLKLMEGKKYFVITSNVDSAFINAGFDKKSVFEVHGSYAMSQCLIDPLHGIFPTKVGEETFCVRCGMIARPNVMYFDDLWFNPDRAQRQNTASGDFFEYVAAKSKKPVILELGVGTTVPRIRQMANRMFRDLKKAPYIHVNLEPEPEFLFSGMVTVPAPEVWIQNNAESVIDYWNS